MLEHGKISVRQLAILVVLFTIASNLLHYPPLISIESGRDAWVAAIVDVLLGLGLIALYLAISRCCPEKTLAEISGYAFGRWLGKVVTLLYAAYFLTTCALLLRGVSDFIKTQVLMQTPLGVLNFALTLIIVVGVRLGLEPLARAGEIFFPIVIVGLVGLLVLVAPQVNTIHMQPVLENGFRPVLVSAFQGLGLPFLQYTVFLVMLPFVDNKKDSGKAIYAGAIVGGFFVVVLVLMSILVLGKAATQNYIYPSYMMAQRISIGKFLERIETSLSGVWYLSIYIKYSLFFYAASYMLARVLDLKTYKPLAVPLGFIVVFLAVVTVPNRSFFEMFGTEVWTPVSLVFGLLIPIVLLVVLKVKQSKEEQTSTKANKRRRPKRIRRVEMMKE